MDRPRPMETPHLVERTDHPTDRVRHHALATGGRVAAAHRCATTSSQQQRCVAAPTLRFNDRSRPCQSSRHLRFGQLVTRLDVDHDRPRVRRQQVIRHMPLHSISCASAPRRYATDASRARLPTSSTEVDSKPSDVLELDPVAQLPQIGDTTMVTPTLAIEDSTRRDPRHQSHRAVVYERHMT